MKNQEFQDTMNKMQEKIGQDASGLIMDDIALLLTDNQTMNKTIEDKDKEIESLKKRNESLMNVNSNLLQQVPMGNEDDLKPEEKEEKKKDPFDFRSVFDEKRKF